MHCGFFFRNHSIYKLDVLLLGHFYTFQNFNDPFTPAEKVESCQLWRALRILLGPWWLDCIVSLLSRHKWESASHHLMLYFTHLPLRLRLLELEPPEYLLPRERECERDRDLSMSSQREGRERRSDHTQHNHLHQTHTGSACPCLLKPHQLPSYIVLPLLSEERTFKIVSALLI